VYSGPGPGGDKLLFHLLQLPAVESIPVLEVLLHFVICLPKAVELCRSCLPVSYFRHKVAIQRHVCNQPWVVGVLDGLVESEVKSRVLEEEPDVFVGDARVLRKVGTVAGGTVDAPGVDFAIVCLLPQLLGDSEVRPKLHIGQGDRAFPQIDSVWRVAELHGPKLPGGLQAIGGERQWRWRYDRSRRLLWGWLWHG
jgi:hypothetical protein